MINAALARSPDHWVVTFPTVNGMTSKVPLYATDFCVADYTGAYGTAIVHPDCRHLLVFLYDGQLYQAIGMPQGLAPSALFWNAHICGGSTFIEVRVQAVRLKLRPRPAVRLTLAL